MDIVSRLIVALFLLTSFGVRAGEPVEWFWTPVLNPDQGLAKRTMEEACRATAAIYGRSYEGVQRTGPANWYCGMSIAGSDGYVSMRCIDGTKPAPGGGPNGSCVDPGPESCKSGEFWWVDARLPAGGECRPHTCTAGERYPVAGAELSFCARTPHGPCAFESVTVVTPKGSRLVAQATGQKCTDETTHQDTPSDASDKAADECGQLVCPPKGDGECKSGYTKGTIAGVVSCVKNTSDTKTEAKTETNPDGSESKTTTKTETKCEGDTCTTTTTTAKQNADGSSTTTGTASKSESRDSFCAQNPKSPQCGESESSFGGTCSSSFTCKGDAVQCAMAREQHRRNCQLIEDKSSPVAQLGETAADGKAMPQGHPGNSPTDVNVSFASIDQTNPYTASCLADFSVSVGGRSISIPLSQGCDVLRFMGYVAVAFTLVIAARITLEAV